MDKNANYDNILLKYRRGITIWGILLSILFIIYGLKTGILTDTLKMDEFIISFGHLAPVIFIFIQIVQVVIPVVPGAISCVFGVVAFGMVEGLVLNYIGIVIGSIIAFKLGREYGMDFVREMTGDKFFSRYGKYLSTKYNYDWIFSFLMFFPLAPDDFLCYLSGMSDMTYKKFLTILLLSKPFSIAFYSIGLLKLFELVAKLR